MTGRRGGRLPPEQWYPAGDPIARARMLRLDSGLRVRVVEAGRPDGAPVLLVHGWACSSYSFRHQLPMLAAAGYRAITFDLPGHGLSDAPDDPAAFATPPMVAHVARVIDALGLERFALVGHSLGGGLASGLALAEPARVARLAVLSAVGFGTIRLVPLLGRLPSPIVEPLLPWLSPRWLFRFVLERLVPGTPGSYSARDIDEYWAATQFPRYVWTLWQLMKHYDWSPLAAEDRARLPALLAIFGGADRIVNVRSVLDPAAVAREGGTHAAVHVLAGIGHAPQEEAPEAVNGLLASFLASWAREWDGSAVG